MKKLFFAIGCFIILASLISCGGLKIKHQIDDEVVDAVEDALDGGTEEDGEATSGGGTDGQDTGDVSGGIEPLEGGDTQSERYFMGTYEFINNSYINGSTQMRCGHGFPNILRLFSHDGLIDFEKRNGQLVWTAEIYDDDTFDFEAVFLDQFGDPSTVVEATCILDEKYYDYYNERVICSCTPSNASSDSCGIAYERM